MVMQGIAVMFRYHMPMYIQAFHLVQPVQALDTSKRFGIIRYAVRAHYRCRALRSDHIRLQKLKSQKMKVSKQLHYNLSASCRA